MSSPTPREEEDREVAAAIRASVAAQQQEDTHRAEDREEGSRPKKEDAAARGSEEPRGSRRLPRTQGEGTGNSNPPGREKLPAPSQHLIFPKPVLTDFPELISCLQAPRKPQQTVL